MSVASIAAFIVAAHSLFMIAVYVVNPEWYEQKAYSAGVSPNLTAAIVTKLILAGVAAGVGFYFL